MGEKYSQSYKLKLTALTPIHIGTGEVYEPTNFVIDGTRFYHFDEVLFYKSLSHLDKVALNAKLENWMAIINFYRTKIDEAKAISDFKCSVTKKVDNSYHKLRNEDGSQNKNQFQIAQTFKNPNSFRAIIPGSSIKGMLDTVLQIYPPKSSNEARQKLIISDALLLDGGVEIGYCYRKHKNPEKAKEGKIPQIVEVIQKDSTFVLSIKGDYSFDDFKRALKRYHDERKDSIYKESPNSFIARVGKFSGLEYMVDDGKMIKNSYGKDVATNTLYEKNDAQFGWIKIELIDEANYTKALDSIKQQEESFYSEREQRQKEIKATIKKAKKEAEAKELARLREREEEERKAKEEQAKREAKLAKMSPVEKLIDSYKNDIPSVINAMKSGEIENYEEIKIELASKIKEILQKDPKSWEKAKQKALKRKEFIESILAQQ